MRTKYVSFPGYFYQPLLFICFLTLFNNLSTPPLEGQSVTGRPKIGLVLSGGGAHGIAHLGVIKVMEEAGLRPDYITGVSMGSIIGGMYSIGYTADSLHNILNSMNWKLILSNKIPENKVIFLEKSHFNNSIVALPLSSRKLMLPSGLISGQQFESELSYYAWPAADISDFSTLPIPFLCLATDIINYKNVNLKYGYLADALRASSSVPSIFTPIKIDTCLFLDGGLIRNFAASEARDMGADILIGSYVGFNPHSEEELQTVSGIMIQIAMYRSVEDFEIQKKMVNLIINPKTEDLPIWGFEQVDSLYERGYKAALPFKNYFRKLADSLNRMGYQKPVKNILNKETYSFDRIDITGNKIYPDYQIRDMLNIRPGDKIDKDMLSEKIELLYGKAWFDKVKYRIVPRNDSLILVVDCFEKPNAMLYGAGHYDNALQSGLIIGFSVKNALTPRSVINLNSYIGQYYRFSVDAIQFLDKNQKFGLSANMYSDKTQMPMLPLRGRYTNTISRNLTTGLSFNRRLGLNHMISLSGMYDNRYLLMRFDPEINLKYLSYDYLTAEFGYNINSLDTKHFPKNGILFNLSASTSKLFSGKMKTQFSKTTYNSNHPGEFSFNRFYTISGNFKQYFPAGKKLTIALGGDILYITDTDSITAHNNFYLLGGIESLNKRSIPMVGFQPNEIPVRKLVGFTSDFDIEIIDKFHLNFLANVFAIQEVSRESGYSLLTGFGAGFGYMSIVGPIKIGIMEGNYSQEKFYKKIKGYISLGFRF